MLCEGCYRMSLSYAHCLVVLYGQTKTIRIRYVWTLVFLKTEEKNLSFQKYANTCRRGLNICLLIG